VGQRGRLEPRFLTGMRVQEGVYNKWLGEKETAGRVRRKRFRKEDSRGDRTKKKA